MCTQRALISHCKTFTDRTARRNTGSGAAESPGKKHPAPSGRDVAIVAVAIREPRTEAWRQWTGRVAAAPACLAGSAGYFFFAIFSAAGPLISPCRASAIMRPRHP